MKRLFFFSSRRRHTRYWRDWSSDVCSSDRETERAELEVLHGPQPRPGVAEIAVPAPRSDAEVAELALVEQLQDRGHDLLGDRSEERRVGKECRSRWSPDP